MVRLMRSIRPARRHTGVGGTIVAGLSLVAATAASAGPPVPVASGWTIFGDSLSDNGNHFAQNGEPGPPYFEGRFSNGPVWCEFLGPMLGVDPAAVTNHAVGFATTDEVLNLQIAPHIADADGPLDANAIHVIAAGSNDFVPILKDPTMNPVPLIEAAIGNTLDSVSTLHAAGARRFLVFTLPNFSLAPALIELGDPFFLAVITTLVTSYNDALNDALDGLEATLAPIELVRFDSQASFADIVADPGAYGLIDVDSAALADDGTVDPQVDGFLYFDDLHPSASGHAILRDQVAALYDVLRPADVTRDGVVDFDDALAVLAAFGPCGLGPCEPDADGDGTVAFGDLLAVLADWDD